MDQSFIDTLEATFRLTDMMQVSGNNVEVLAAVRENLRKLFQMASQKKEQEVNTASAE